MKQMILAILAMGFLSMAGATESKVEIADYFGPAEEMDYFDIVVSDVKGIDVLVDYKMVKVGCHGLPYNYSGAIDFKAGRVYVSKYTAVHVSGPCKPSMIQKQEQAGWKVFVPATEDSRSVSISILVPKGSKVEYVRH